MARRHGVDSFARGYRKTRRLQELGGADGDRGLVFEVGRDLHSAIRSALFGARVSHRSQAWPFDSGICARSSGRLMSPAAFLICIAPIARLMQSKLLASAMRLK